VDVVINRLRKKLEQNDGLQDPAHRARGGLRGEGRLMSTLRQKLTVWYTAAVLATLTAFGATLYIDRRVSTARELDQRLALEANLSGYWLAESQRVLGRIVAPEDGVPKLDPGITRTSTPSGTTSSSRRPTGGRSTSRTRPARFRFPPSSG
jgi:hypothetical protein